MLKRPERKERVATENAPLTDYSNAGWNACHSQWLAYHKQEMIKARIDELQSIVLDGHNETDLDRNIDRLNKRIATLQSELKEIQ